MGNCLVRLVGAGDYESATNRPTEPESPINRAFQPIPSWLNQSFPENIPYVVTYAICTEQTFSFTPLKNSCKHSGVSAYCDAADST